MPHKTYSIKWQLVTCVGLALCLATSCNATPNASKPDPEAEAAAAALQSRINEGRIYIGQVTLAQMEYHKKHTKYAPDLKALLTEQKIEVKMESENYTYSTAESKDGTFKVFKMIAIPKTDDLPSIVGVSYVQATILDQTIDGKQYVSSTSERRICETVSPSKTPPSSPVSSGWSIDCAPGTQESKW